MKTTKTAKTQRTTHATPTRFTRTAPAQAAPNKGNCGQGSNWVSRGLRLAVMLRQDFDATTGTCACAYCGKRVAPGRGTNGQRRNVMHLDHVVPVSLGGDSRASNLVACCRDCNARKGARTGAEFIRDQIAERGLRRAAQSYLRNLVSTRVDRAAGLALAKKGM